MAAIIASPLFPYGKSLLKSKNRILFRKKKTKHLNFTQRTLKQRHMICYETVFLIENYRQIQNGGHERPK